MVAKEDARCRYSCVKLRSEIVSFYFFFIMKAVMFRYWGSIAGIWQRPVLVACRSAPGSLFEPPRCLRA